MAQLMKITALVGGEELKPVLTPEPEPELEPAVHVVAPPVVEAPYEEPVQLPIPEAVPPNPQTEDTAAVVKAQAERPGLESSRTRRTESAGRLPLTDSVLLARPWERE